MTDCMHPFSTEPLKSNTLTLLVLKLGSPSSKEPLLGLNIHNVPSRSSSPHQRPTKTLHFSRNHIKLIRSLKKIYSVAPYVNQIQ